MRRMTPEAGRLPSHVIASIHGAWALASGGSGRPRTSAMPSSNALAGLAGSASGGFLVNAAAMAL